MSEVKLISIYCNTNERFKRTEGFTYFSFAQDLENGKTRWFNGVITDQKLFEALKPHLKEAVL